MSARYGRYEVVCKLGEGAMAAVHLARDPVLDRFVAVKVLHHGVAANQTALQRFFNEAKVVAKVRNPHVVEVFDFGKEAGDFYLVMEFVDGRSLHSVLKQLRPGEPLDDIITACLMVQAAEGLDLAARHGVVHRDIKPENLMLNSQGYLKIADFGIAHLQDESLTRTGAVLGSPLYMSPEQVRGAKPITSQSDMFSLGAVLYRCLTGSPPFAAATLKELYRKIAQEPHVPLRHARPDLEPSLAALAESLLDKDPSRRGQGPRWVRAELRAFLLSRGVDDPMERVCLHLRELAQQGVQTTWRPDRDPDELPRTVASTRPMLVEEGTKAAYSAERTAPRTQAIPPSSPVRFPWMVAAVTSLLLLAASAVYYGYQASAVRKPGRAVDLHSTRPAIAQAGGAGSSVRNGRDGISNSAATGEGLPHPVSPGVEGAAGEISLATGSEPVGGEAPAGSQSGTGSLLVLSSPPFAEVYLDGRNRGVTPVRLTGLSAGPHRLLVQGRSGRPVDTLLRVGRETRTVRVRLEPGEVAMEDVEDMEE